MTPEERSRLLRREADAVLARVHLREHCASIGQIVPTGSYFLDLMMYPDIDLYLPPVTPADLFSLAAKLVRYDCVKKMNFEKGGPGDLENGLYLKPIIEHGNWERPWKIDMWSLPPRVVEKKRRELEDLKSRMTPVHRRRILSYKFSVLTDSGRTPMYSGIHVCRAVIDLGLEDFGRITDYLRANGISV